MVENPKKQTAWICRLDQYPPMIINPVKNNPGSICLILKKRVIMMKHRAMKYI